MSSQTIHPSQKKLAAAKVNGVVINQYQVETGLEAVLEPYKDVKGKVRLSQQQRYAARKHVIDNLITRELLYQEGCKKKITATDEEISQVLAKSTEEYETEQQFKAMLVMMGLSPAEYRDQVKRDIIVNKFAASLVEGKRKPVTTKEARKYYDDHPEEMTGAEVRKVLHVFKMLDRYASSQDEQHARQELQQATASKAAVEKIVSRKAVAQSGITGEDLGFVAPGQLHPLLESVAFRLQEGEVSRIVRTEEGLHVVLVKIILEQGKLRPFDLVEEELKKKIYEMRSVAMLNQCTDKLREKAAIEMFDQVADNKLAQEED